MVWNRVRRSFELRINYRFIFWLWDLYVRGIDFKIFYFIVWVFEYVQKHFQSKFWVLNYENKNNVLPCNITNRSYLPHIEAKDEYERNFSLYIKIKFQNEIPLVKKYLSCMLLYKCSWDGRTAISTQNNNKVRKSVSPSFDIIIAFYFLCFTCVTNKLPASNWTLFELQ